MILLAELTQPLVAALGWLVIASVKTIPLIIFVFAIQYFFRKQLSAAAHYCLWLGVLISLAIPFGWNMSLGQLANSDSAITAAEQTAPSTLNSNALATAMSPKQLLPQPTNPWLATEISLLQDYYPLLLAIIWLCGVLGLSAITLVSAAYFHRVKKNARPAPMDLLQLLNHCKTELQVKQSIQLLTSDKIQSPITLGWLSPAVVLPEGIQQQLAPAALKHILLHELGHIKRQDIFCNWTACAINILHWFNPFVWLACRKMRMDMEVACDALVLRHLPTVQHKSYGATLIAISEVPRASRRAITTLGILENHTELKERLTMIKEFSTMNIKSKVLLSIILMATAITSLAQPNLESSAQARAKVAVKNSAETESSTTIKAFAARAEKDLKTKILVGQHYADLKIQVNLGTEPLDYGQLLTQLKINDFTAYKSKDYIQIIPMRDARSVNIPVVEQGKTYFEDEVVTDYLRMEKVCSDQAVATLRPLIPQNSHLSSYADGRTLVISDTYGNIQRIKSVLKSLDDNLNAPVDCKKIQPPEERPQNKSSK